VAEVIDWVMALVSLGDDDLRPESVDGCLGALVKYPEDFALIRRHGVEELVAAAKRAAVVELPR
jgi:hypothetical protein